MLSRSFSAKHAGLAAALVLLAIVLAVGIGRRPPAEAADTEDERAEGFASEARNAGIREAAIEGPSFEEGGFDEGGLDEGGFDDGSDLGGFDGEAPAPVEPTPARASEPTAFGLVAGALLLADGTPVPNAWISFVDPTRDYVVAKRSHARTDEHGFYEIRLGAQRWNVWYAGEHRSGSARPCGSLEVPADAVVRWDVVLDGSRTLRGEFVVAAEDLSDLGEDETQPLLIEVRRHGEREVLGQCEALTRRAVAPGADPQVDDAPDPPPAGSFAIEALPAELLELRIVLPGGYRHPLTGVDHVMYVSRTVDLHAGDVVLPREEFRMQDFFDATLRRLLEEDR